MAMSNKVRQRLVANLSKFQKALQKAKDQDVNETDTVKIITDMLSYLFGYDKYTEITSEYAIRGTYCDLAIKMKDKIRLLIECKAIGIDLKENYIKQAVDYAANYGLEWVVLTNGVKWQIYHMIFAKPIDKELIYEVNFLDLKAKHNDDLEALYLLTKEGLTSAALEEFYEKQQAVNKYTVAAVIQSDPVIAAIRREIRKYSKGIKVSETDIERLLAGEVLKREVVEEERAVEARKRLSRAAKRQSKTET
jgi:hypothetical protein